MYSPIFYTLFLTLWYVPIFTVGYITNIRANPHSGQPKINVLQNMFCLTKKKLDMNHDFKNLHPLFKKTEMTQI